MQLEEKLSVIEAILFASGEPIDGGRLSVAAGVEYGELKKLTDLMNAGYSERGSALEILTLEDSYQLATKEKFAPYIRAAMETRKNAALSPAAMEVLTIVAYNQPVTRSFIDDIRGVDSGGVVNNLIEKELIEESGRLDIPGRPVLFKTTDNFLRCFKLSSVADLPLLPDTDSQLSFDDVQPSE